MNLPARRLFLGLLVSTLSAAAVLGGKAANSQEAGAVGQSTTRQGLPEKEFSNPPLRPHGPKDLVFAFDQLDHYYRVPGEFTHRLTGDQYGFEALSFIITETHPGGGPGLHVHDSEEAHVLIEGTARYQIGDQTFTVDAPYVARVPAGVAHTFINAGGKPFSLVAVFASKHPITTRIGPNPLIPLPKKPVESQPAVLPSQSTHLSE